MPSTHLNFDEIVTPLLGTDEAKAILFDEVRVIWLDTDEAKATLFITKSHFKLCTSR
jgi:hypothetical protein